MILFYTSFCFDFFDDKKPAPGLKEVAGAGGFEPPNAGIKIRCLTTWRRPSKKRKTGQKERAETIPYLFYMQLTFRFA